MRITICGSMRFAADMLRTKEALERMGHQAFVPSDTRDCVANPHLNHDM
jgi:hypothetical protein